LTATGGCRERATSRGVWLALMCLRGEMAYPSALTAAGWGVHDTLLRGEPQSAISIIMCA